jgi:DNA-binding transcriptional ArsR family regulator
MTSEEPRRVDLTDPKAMRAMAHPVRMALLELLRVNGTLTATQASETLGESPANCAFHLRTLAKYGFVEEAGGGKGRERPWRYAPVRVSVDSQTLDDPQARIAADTLSRAWGERWMERARRSLDTSYNLPAPWRGATHVSNTVTFLTPDELSTLIGEVRAVLDRYRDKRSPGDRPEGSMPVELLFFGYPLTDFTGPDRG